MTVRDVQHAVLSLGYSQEQILRNCPKAPEGDEGKLGDFALTIWTALTVV